MPKISVIVPVYNSEKYLARTVSAILNQDEKDIEVLLIDDGSTDRSLEICLQYAELDSRVKCIHTENGGPGHARNIGMGKATGDWLVFCDADDIPDRSMYRKLVCKVTDTDADLCVCDFYSERDGKRMGFPWENEYFKGKDICNIFMASMIGNLSDNTKDVPFWGSSCRSIYKRCIITEHKIKFPEDITFAEDLIFNLRYAMYCNVIIVLRECLYYYTYNSNSVMNSHCCQHVQDMFNKRKRLVRYIEGIIKDVKAEEQLRSRLRTTERCYYSECIGNACTKTLDRSMRDMISETRDIMCDKYTREAFQSFDAKTIKKRMLYLIIRYRLVCVAFIYYRIRLCRREKECYESKV